MGIYAEAYMWAEMNGYEDGDMPPEAWMQFYDEYDGEPYDERRERTTKLHCPICGRGKIGLRQHIEAVHKNEKGRRALSELPAHPTARKPGHWLRGDGTQTPIKAMNPHHRAAAARKARAAGDEALAQELEGEG